jgi:hypothetical protein
MVGQNLSGAAAEKRAQEDHDHLVEILKDIQEDHQALAELVASLKK